MNNTAKKTTGLVQMALFTAIIFIMALVPGLGYIPLGVIRATIIHVPVMIGALVLGPKKGAILGGIFGLTSLINNTFAPTITSFVFSPFYTLGEIHGGLQSLIICFLPRILIGIVSYYVYQLVRKMLKQHKHSMTISLVLAGIAGSLTNTLLVMNLIYFLFGESYAAAKEITYEALYGTIMMVIGTNGIPEAIVAAILVTAIGRVFLKTKIQN